MLQRELIGTYQRGPRPTNLAYGRITTASIRSSAIMYLVPGSVFGLGVDCSAIKFIYVHIPLAFHQSGWFGYPQPAVVIRGGDDVSCVAGVLER